MSNPFLPEVPPGARQYDSDLSLRLFNLLDGLDEGVRAALAAALAASSSGTVAQTTKRMAMAGGLAALPVTFGFAGFAFTATGAGTNTAATPTTTNALTSLYRSRVNSTAAVNTGGSLNTGLGGAWLGNAAGLGGFTARHVFGIETPQAGMRVAVGLFPNAAVSMAVEPSTYLNSVFVGADSTDANLQLMSNDGAGACTKVDLGANFPKGTAGALYRLTLSAAANGTEVAYTVERLDVAATTSGVVNANLPANTFFMTPQTAFGNGTTAAIAIGAYIRNELEMPY